MVLNIQLIRIIYNNVQGLLYQGQLLDIIFLILMLAKICWLKPKHQKRIPKFCISLDLYFLYDKIKKCSLIKIDLEIRV